MAMKQIIFLSPSNMFLGTVILPSFDSEVYILSTGYLLRDRTLWFQVKYEQRKETKSGFQPV